MPDEISNRNVFILGAGFSADAGAPLIRNFLDVSREFLDDPDSQLDDVERGYFKAVFDFKKKVAQAREKFRIDLDNIEELFGLVEMSHRLGKTPPATRNAMVYLIAKTLQLAVNRQKDNGPVRFGVNRGFESFSNRFASFVKAEQGNPSVYNADMYDFFALLLAGRFDDPAKTKSRTNVVITFNYDLVLDDALQRISAGPSYALSDTEGQSPEVNQQRESGVLLLKLHGSTNWVVCESCKKVRVLDRKATENPEMLRTMKCSSCNKTVRFLLVPPSWDKSEHNEPMRPVWRKAVESLETATRICVIGYSMPDSDAFFRFLLTLGLAENHQLYKFILVDKIRRTLPGFSTSNENTNTVSAIDERYKRMLEDMFVERRFVFEGDGLISFLRGTACGELGRGEAIFRM